MKRYPDSLTKEAAAAVLATGAGTLHALVQSNHVGSIEPTRWDAFLARIEAGKNASLEAFTVWIEEDEEEEDESAYRVLADGTAIVPIYGILLDTAPAWWLSWYGATSTPQVTQWIEQARADANVKRVLLDIDSPGGQVGGIANLADATFALSASGKPVWALCRQACSAAYWVGSQADKMISRKDADVGCIGTLILLGDWSNYYSEMGVEMLRITSTGAETYKGAGARGTKITEAQRTDFVRQCDEGQKLFNAAISRGRGISLDDAAALADGRYFMGYVALEMGLVDELGNPDEVLMRFGGEEGAAKDPPPGDSDPCEEEEARRKKCRASAISGQPENKPGQSRTGGRDTMTLKDRILAAFKGGNETNDEKLEAAAEQIESITAERDSLSTQNQALKTELEALKAENQTLKAGQQTEEQKKLSAARERAEKAAVAAKAENLEATKATIAALTDVNVLEAMAGAWETAAKSATNPERQSNSDDPATGEEKFDAIREQVANRYQQGGYSGKSLKTKEGK